VIGRRDGQLGISIRKLAVSGFINIFSADRFHTSADVSVFFSSAGTDPSDGIPGVGPGVGQNCPALYWEIKSLLLIARTGEHRIIKIATIPTIRSQVFISIQVDFG
jgi:hypothetical protein